MRAIQRLLACTDFSSGGDAAVAYAVALAAQLHADVVLTNAFNGQVMMQRELLRPPSARDLDTRQKVALRRLSELAQTLSGSGVSIRCVAVHGDPRHEIPRLAQEEGVDLIVVGKYGHSGLSRLFVGSVADSLIRNASVPVLAIGELAVAAARRDLSAMKAPLA